MSAEVSANPNKMPDTREHRVALITGANSNLGLSICYRLLEKCHANTRITLVLTSRTLPRVNELIETLKKFVFSNPHFQKLNILVDYDYLLIDFTNMISVFAAAHELNTRYDRLDYYFANSAFGVFDGIDWLQAVKEILINPLDAVTAPTYKLQQVGVKSQDGLGAVFQANVFGPWYIINKILPLLSNANGKIIWISSLMSDPKYLDLNDIEMIKNTATYEGSKRLVDLLHYATFEKLLSNHGVASYLVQPGIFQSTSFAKFLNNFTYWGMLLLFYFARILGSPWHNISGYTAANAVVWTAVDANPKIDSQLIKYGSACRLNGTEYIRRNDVDTTGSEKVLDYIEKLRIHWDAKLKDQIVDTRKAE